MNELEAGLRAPAAVRCPAEAPPRCPVCQARFRGTRVCSRCGADLTPLMRIAARAWRLRESARDALAGGAAHRAWDLAAGAERLHRTPQGARLLALTRWLASLDDR